MNSALIQMIVRKHLTTDISTTQAELTEMLYASDEIVGATSSSTACANWIYDVGAATPSHGISFVVVAKWHFRLPNFSTSDIRPTDFLFFGGHIFGSLSQC
jgi:hypothetical protein